MKKLGLFFTLFCFYAIYALFIAVPSASADSAECIYRNTGTCSIYPTKSLECPVPGVTAPNVWCCPNDPSCNDLILKRQPPAAPAAGAATPTCDAPGGDSSEDGTPTALGCIPNQPAEAIKLILPWAIGLGTGLAFLLFLYGAFTLITAGSDPQKVDSGKSVITSAASGLIFIILSILLLRVIGIDILKL